MLTEKQTALADTLEALDLKISPALDLLIDQGLLSDHVITLEDAADSDCDRARAWLESNYDPRML